MPKRKFSSATRKSLRKLKRYRVKRQRSAYGRPKRSIGSRTSLGMPRTFKTKLLYVQEFTLDPGTYSTSQSFRANDLYDPDYTGLGHQPRGFDQLTPFYQRFYVVGSRIRVKQVIMPNQAVSNMEPMYWGIDITRSPTELDGLTQSDIIERVKTYKLGGNFFNTSTVTQNKSKKFSTKKHFSVKSMIGDNSYYCTDGASPSNVGYFTCWAAPCMGNNPGAQFFIAEIEYIVICTVHKDEAAQS